MPGQFPKTDTVTLAFLDNLRQGFPVVGEDYTIMHPADEEPYNKTFTCMEDDRRAFRFVRQESPTCVISTVMLLSGMEFHGSDIIYNGQINYGIYDEPSFSFDERIGFLKEQGKWEEAAA